LAASSAEDGEIMEARIPPFFSAFHERFWVSPPMVSRTTSASWTTSLRPFGDLDFELSQGVRYVHFADRMLPLDSKGIIEAMSDEPSLNELWNSALPQFVCGQSIRQHPPGNAVQNSRCGGVPRAWW
jgi:hypothetical protein